ncbi:AglZ/HisF2 family acetamidino modification protein [Steroidobacter denitrificans]|uniref:AglZ/HisF2 family acetamidino modification protein n=1 Tax=Steroidobacter denitrificans TaxID=465721 RepID=UPI0009F96A68|nr:AglZ/HisF2 family acetamidino modification protein [Steroidobacter denitrificans]
MLIPRVIPCLLLTGSGLIKTRRFRHRRYVGDIINAVRIFNDKEVDELLVLDIDATIVGYEPRLDIITSIAGECFMPLAYGGGISSMKQAEELFTAGVEKVVVNSAAIRQPELIKQVSSNFGSQSVVVCIDYKRNWLGRVHTYIESGRKCTGMTPLEHAGYVEAQGAGEIIIQSIERDGCRMGYDLDLIRQIASATNVPLIACGGAHQLTDFSAAIDRGASAVSAGSMFVFHGKHQAVLITYPERHELESIFQRAA